MSLCRNLRPIYYWPILDTQLRCISYEFFIQIRRTSHADDQIVFIEQIPTDALQCVCHLSSLLVERLRKLADKAVISNTALLFLIRSHIREIGHQAAGRNLIPSLIQNRFHLRGFPADDFLQLGQIVERTCIEYLSQQVQ
ncbi:hypothetical protein D3C78_833730 [compost metagenome]